MSMSSVREGALMSGGYPRPDVVAFACSNTGPCTPDSAWAPARLPELPPVHNGSVGHVASNSRILATLWFGWGDFQIDSADVMDLRVDLFCESFSILLYLTGKTS